MHSNCDAAVAVVELNVDVSALVAVDKAAYTDMEHHNRAVALLVCLMMTTGFRFERCADLINSMQ